MLTAVHMAPVGMRRSRQLTRRLRGLGCGPCAGACKRPGLGSDDPTMDQIAAYGLDSGSFTMPLFTDVLPTDISSFSLIPTIPQIGVVNNNGTLFANVPNATGGFDQVQLGTGSPTSVASQIAGGISSLISGLFGKSASSTALASRINAAGATPTTAANSTNIQSATTYGAIALLGIAAIVLVKR